MPAREFHLPHKVQRGAEFGLALAGKPGDHISRDGGIWQPAARRFDQVPGMTSGVVLRRMRLSVAAHPLCSGRCKWRQRRASSQRSKNPASRSHGSSEDSLSLGASVSFRIAAHQISEMEPQVSSPRAQVDSRQHDLLCAALQRAAHIRDDLAPRTAASATPGDGGHTECAVIVAAILDLDEGSRAMTCAGYRLPR